MKISLGKIIGGLWFSSFIMILAKLFGIISFSWWLVTSPIWFTVGLVVALCASLFIFLMTRTDKQLDRIEKKLEEIKTKYNIK